VGRDNVAERADQMAKVGDCHLGHAQVYGSAARDLFLGSLKQAFSGAGAAEWADSEA
jgi:hypothetical protein